jgi:hypothetical protein
MAGGRQEKPRKAHGEHEDRGPKGGTTTLTASGMVKKNLWVTRSMAERLREEAYQRRTSEAEIIRQALTRHFRQARPGPAPKATD